MFNVLKNRTNLFQLTHTKSNKNSLTRFLPELMTECQNLLLSVEHEMRSDCQKWDRPCQLVGRDEKYLYLSVAAADRGDI